MKKSTLISNPHSWVLGICTFLLCSGSISLPAVTPIKDLSPIPILSPAFAERKTAKMRLDNDLEVYLISDPKVDKSAAALSVNTGSLEDPDEFLGLAHFLEHMLFLGTKKYPVESEYLHFIQANGGTRNASTGPMYTNYMFDVNDSAFPEALDRFSQFFKEPLFNQSGVNREMNSVHNEFSSHVENDGYREFLVFQELANQKHPLHRFTIGNLTSLEKATTNDLRKWYEQHYSSNMMTLVLYSPRPLEDLKKLAIDLFSDIPNRNLSPLHIQEPLFSPSTQGKIAYIAPVEEHNILSLMWMLPPSIVQARDSKPEDIVCYILGHEGEGSLAAELKKQGLIAKISCSAERMSYEEIVLGITIELTKEGANRLYQVIQTIFDAIESYKKKGVPKYLFDEIRTMELLKFQYPSRSQAFEEVSLHVKKMRFEDLRSYPQKTEVIQQFSPELVKEIFNSLTPDRAFIDLMATPDILPVKFDKKEHWMKIPYAVRPIPKDIFLAWKQAKADPQISIPQPNQWIPRHQTLLNTQYQKQMPHPDKLIDNGIGILYFAQDHLYLIPEASLSFLIKSPKLNPGNPLDAVLTELHLNIVEEGMKKISYDAEMAGLTFDLKRTEEGIAITINGYSEKTPRLIQELADYLKNYRTSPEQFQLIKECLTRQYQSALKQSPFRLAVQDFRDIFYEHYVTDSEKLDAIESITFEDFLTFTHTLYDKIYVQALFYGNMESEQAKQVWSQLAETLGSAPFPEGKEEKTRVLILPKDKGPFLIEKSVKNKGNALLISTEQYPFSFKGYATQDILSNNIDQEFFNELRTKQQTAYLVAQKSEESYGMLINLFGIESHSHLARDLLARTELFLEQQVEGLRNGTFTEDLFTTIRQALVTQLKTPPDNLEEMGGELFSMLIKNEADFDWKTKRLQGLEELTYQEFIEKSINLLSRKNRRRLAILIKGSLSKEEDFNYTRKTPQWMHDHSTYE